MGKAAARMDDTAAAAAAATTAAAATVTGSARRMDASAVCSATSGSAAGTPCSTATRIPRSAGPATTPASTTADRFWVRPTLNFFSLTDDKRNRSNNPFAPAASPASPVSSPQLPAQSSPLSNFSLPSTFESHELPPRNDYATLSKPAPAPSPQPTVKRSQTRADQDHAHLASLFAERDGDGVDTFGNLGALRYVILTLSKGWASLNDVLYVALDSLTTADLRHRRRALPHRTTSIRLRSRNNKHRIANSRSSLFEGGVFA